ncbi:glycosyltransferase, partial [Bacillus sp. HC-TM]
MLNKQGITISLCMIVRDEEETIARCLDTVEKIVDEIIVVDTGSVDRTIIHKLIVIPCLFNIITLFQINHM